MWGELWCLSWCETTLASEPAGGGDVIHMLLLGVSG